MQHELTSEAESSPGHIPLTGVEMPTACVGKQTKPHEAEHEALAWVSFIGAN